MYKCIYIYIYCVVYIYTYAEHTCTLTYTYTYAWTYAMNDASLAQATQVAARNRSRERLRGLRGALRFPLINEAWRPGGGRYLDGKDWLPEIWSANIFFSPFSMFPLHYSNHLLLPFAFPTGCPHGPRLMRVLALLWVQG